MNVAIQDRHGAELLQVGEGLRAVVRAPAPLRIDRPQWNVSENNNGCAVLKISHISFEPLDLLTTQGSQASRFEVHDVDQANKVNAILVEAVPALSFVTLY